VLLLLFDCCSWFCSLSRLLQEKFMQTKTTCFMLSKSNLRVATIYDQRDGFAQSPVEEPSLFFRMTQNYEQIIILHPIPNDPKFPKIQNPRDFHNSSF
jgi:hypothetical protein